VAATIVDVKFRFEVIRHLMSKSVSKMPIFFFGGEVWVIFCGGRNMVTFGGALLNYTQSGYCLKV